MISFDWAMKRLLRSKANYDVLEGFLSELLYRDIKIQSISESESNKETEEDKSNRVDILVEADGKEMVIIELQFDREYDYFHRMLYGTSKVIVEYMDMGDAYENVRKVYSINIVYFDLGVGEDYVYHGVSHFKGLHTNDELRLNEKQKQLYNKQFIGELYPEYYILKVNNFNDVAKNTLDEWIYYLKNNKIQDHFTAKGMGRARKVLAKDNMSEEEKRNYERNIEGRRVKMGEMFSARYDGRVEGLAEGKAEGLAEGLAKGKAEGLAEGEAKGKAEGLAEGEAKEKLAIAKNLKSHGMPFDQIAEITNLSIEEIEKIGFCRNRNER
jgi:predicted transposase/invertase (TIGR01784 family)